VLPSETFPLHGSRHVRDTVPGENRRIVKQDSTPSPTSDPRNRRDTLLAPPRDRRRAGVHYTRFVGLMRWLLVFGAIALAATVIIWPYFNGRGTAPSQFDLPTTGIEIKDGRPTMINARFLATDENGQPYTITADLAWQEQGVEEIIFMDVIEGDILLQSGAWMTLSADRGVFDQTEQRLILESNVNLFSDAGYELHTQEAQIDLASGTAQGDMQVDGQGPAGLLTAGGFVISDNGDRIRFTGPVHMTIFPGQKP